MQTTINLSGLSLLLDTPETRVQATQTIIHHLFATDEVSTQISLLNLLKTQNELPSESLHLLENPAKQSKLRPGVRMYLRDLIAMHRSTFTSSKEHAFLSVAFGPLPN